MSCKRPRTIVIGIGNPDRGDDAAGPAALARLRGRLAPGIELIENNGEATALLALLEDAVEVYMIDACRSGRPPGTLHRIDALAHTLPPDGSECSTHGLGVAQGLELARVLGLLPPRCVVYLIEGESYEPGAPLSAAVCTAVASLAERLIAELEPSPHRRHRPA